MLVASYRLYAAPEPAMVPARAKSWHESLRAVDSVEKAQVVLELRLK